MALPALFLSHGAPTLALDASAAGTFMDRLATRWPRPRAVVIASAHFASRGATRVGGNPRPRTVHDFGGFPEALYRLRYEPPGDPKLARSIVERLGVRGLPALLAPQQDLDHGAWVPLLRLFPAADIPVVPVSIDPLADARAHYALGQALAELREEQVLLIGSGGFVHNLGALEWQRRDGTRAAWAAGFADWMRERLLQRDLDAVLDWQTRAPNARQAHPTPEHLLPLFVALGAAGDWRRSEELHHSTELGSLALDAWAFD